MAKKQTHFSCQQCGAIQQKWSGQCSACLEWDCIVEEVNDSFSHATNTISNNASASSFVSLAGQTTQASRIATNNGEFDRVLGGGLVHGSAVLIGGDPGIGKSTLVLQTVASLASHGYNTAYITGEESIEQVRLRAKRLRVSDADVKLMTATSVKNIIASLKKAGKMDVIIIDSIQTMYLEELGSAPGTVSQVRAASHELICYAKKHQITIIFVGHVTKEGQIAGPKLLEHMVDTVLYFENERGEHYRVLRAVKNRFGAANEIGIFEMQEQGLVEVSNPSASFLPDRHENVSGSVIFAGIEGTRPVLVEVQALVSQTQTPTPRRAVVGWDTNRLAMVIAILQNRFGCSLSDKEIYLNIAGGLRVNEPAADLAIALALISSLSNIALAKDLVVFGELGLSGEVRSVSHMETRLKEASKLGFHQACIPSGKLFVNKSFILKQINHIRESKSFFGELMQAHT